MLYYIEKKPKKIDKKFFDSVIDYSLSFLGLYDTCKDYTLILVFGDIYDKHVSGYFDVDTTNKEVIIYIRDFLSKEDITKTIFHELVHVYQVFSGKFNVEERTWYGVKNESKYTQLPWEIEAYILEEEMYERYMMEKSYKEIKEAIQEAMILECARSNYEEDHLIMVAHKLSKQPLNSVREVFHMVDKNTAV